MAISNQAWTVLESKEHSYRPLSSGMTLEMIKDVLISLILSLAIISLPLRVNLTLLLPVIFTPQSKVCEDPGSTTLKTMVN